MGNMYLYTGQPRSRDCPYLSYNQISSDPSILWPIHHCQDSLTYSHPLLETDTRMGLFFLLLPTSSVEKGKKKEYVGSFLLPSLLLCLMHR